MKRWALALVLLGSIGCGKEAETPPAVITRTPDPTVSEADLAGATAIELNKLVDGKLADPVKARSFFKFTGKAGEFLSITTKTANDNYDETYVDTVVALYDANRARLGRNDDTVPRQDNGNSQLLTRIPADGTYYVSVGGCATIYGTELCGDGSGTTHLEFQVEVASNLFANDGALASAQQDGTKAKADTIRYKVSEDDETYFPPNYVAGAFTKAGETHVFTFTAPTAIWVEEGFQAWTRFWVMPIGDDQGNGSMANVKLWAEDSAGNKLAEADQRNYGTNFDANNNAPLLFTFPIALGQPYFVFVQSTATTAHPDADFYVMSGWNGEWRSQPEAEVGNAASNDQSDKAEVYAPSHAYENTAGVVGTIATPADVDWFVADVPEGMTKVRDFCFSQRYGSGVRGFTAAYFAEDDKGAVTELPTLSYAETANVDPRRSYLTLPDGTAKIRARFSATSLDAQVQGRYYACNLYFK